MGRPLPGYPVVLVDPVTGAPGQDGEICLDLSRRPLGLMTGYLDDAERDAEAMRGGYYHTGDVASADADGYITYVGRTDDVFKASDYRISPFELESVLIEHSAVAEAAVVPSPDPLRLAVPKAYVLLAADATPGPELAKDIMDFVRMRVPGYKRIRRLDSATCRRPSPARSAASNSAARSTPPAKPGASQSSGRKTSRRDQHLRPRRVSLVNGRHLSFGDDPRREMWVGGQLFNVHQYNAVPPKSLRVWLEYGRDGSYGHAVEAEIRELLTHVPVWDGKPGVLRASRTLNADQFFVHAHLRHLTPGTRYHYRFRYTAGPEQGATADGTFWTAPGEVAEPFTFTAFGDEGIPGPSLDRDPSLLPETDWGMWNNGGYDADDPDNPARTRVNTTSAVITQITRVRNLANGTPARFNLLAGDLCYAQAEGDIQPIINPNGPNGSQPDTKNTPQPAPNSGVDYSHGAQARWLEHQLAAWRGDGKIDFIVAFFHECAFSTCDGHSSDGGVRSKVAPLFSRYQVDLAIQGHNHVYERTNPLSYDAKTNSAKSSRQAVAHSPSEPAEVEPARDGTTYVTVGTAGTPRYGWTGPHEADRNFAAGSGSGTIVTADAKKETGPYVTELDFSQRFETVDWSQARYADYGFIALDVTPAPQGQRTTMTLRFINQQGRELDRVIFSRTAGGGLIG